MTKPGGPGKAKANPVGPNFGGAPPAPPAKQGQALGAQLEAMLKGINPAWVKYEPALLKWSAVYNMDPLQLAAVLAGIENPSANPKAVSSAGARGLAQILDTTVNRNANPNATWDGPTVLTDAWKENPNNAIKYAAWRLSAAVSANAGDINAAYVSGYNPGYTGKMPSSFLPKGYTPTTGSGTQPTPAETAGPSVAGTLARKGLATTQWAVLRNGKVKFVTTRDSYDTTTGAALPSAPKGTLTIFGQPLSSSAFLQQYSSITDDYLAYTGKRPSFAAAAHVIQNGVSQFQLRQNLAQDPGFVNSPVWKQNAPGYTAVWQSVYGPSSTPDTQAIRDAIANNVGSSGFQAELRQRPDYTNSTEYKQTAAAMTNVYAQIYGQPTEADQPTIHAAVMNGYDANTFATYLRNQPQWKSSPEAQSLYYGLASKMGLISGAQNVLASAPTQQALPAAQAPPPPAMTGGGS